MNYVRFRSLEKATYTLIQFAASCLLIQKCSPLLVLMEKLAASLPFPLPLKLHQRLTKPMGKTTQKTLRTYRAGYNNAQRPLVFTDSPITYKSFVRSGQIMCRPCPMPPLLYHQARARSKHRRSSVSGRHQRSRDGHYNYGSLGKGSARKALQTSTGKGRALA